MKIIVYVAPFWMRTSLQFAQSLSKLRKVHLGEQGVYLIGISQQAPKDASVFDRVILVKNALDRQELQQTLLGIQQHFGKIHRLLGILEQLQEVLAEVREDLNIVGERPTTVEAFRDKAVMKERLSAAGIRCAQFIKTHQWSDVQHFAQKYGFPVVVKPPAGAGCKSTVRCQNMTELQQAFQSIPKPLLVEEFLTGTEHSMEGFVLKGEVQMLSCSRYYPTPLEVMENPWIQWAVHFPKDLSSPKFQQAKIIGAEVIKALGIQTAMTHMEWFCRENGEIVVGEIGGRPPGARFVDCTSAVYGRNVHDAWARLMVFEDWQSGWHRQNGVMIVFLRAQGKGRIASIVGLDAAQKQIGSLVIDVHLPQKGQIKGDGYEGDGWVILQHSDDQMLLKAAQILLRTVQVRCTE